MLILVEFAAWAVFSSITDVLNKSLLSSAPFPLTLTLSQFLISGLLAEALSFARKERATGKDESTSSPTLPASGGGITLGTAVISACQAAGFGLTNMSFGSLSVAFTHTVKGAMPLVSLAICFARGERFSGQQLAAVLPIVLGVALCSATELSFSAVGFTYAMGSNVFFAFRDVLAKGLFAGPKSDEMEVYRRLSWGAAAALAPFWIASGGLSLVTAAFVLRHWPLLLVNGVTHFIYSSMSFLILGQVTPLTHAVLNVARRIVVIAASVVAARAVPSLANILGMTMVFCGVYFFLKANKKEEKKKNL